MTYFNANKIEIPKTTDKNLLSDVAEFLCLVSETKQLTLDEIKDRESDSLISDPDQDNETEFNSDEDEMPDSYYSDKLDSNFREIFNFLLVRSERFGEYYPFEIHIDKKGTKIQLKECLTPIQNIYIILLLSSKLNIFQKTDQNKLGHKFELLCELPFRKLVSPQTTILFTGAGAGNVELPILTGNFYQKIKTLGEKINTETTKAFDNAKEIHIQSSGDGGMDWLAYFTFEDKCPNLPLFIGQCACGEQWIDKQFDAHPDKIGTYLELKQPYLLFHFIPKSFRNENFTWQSPSDVYQITLVDRFRLIQLFKLEANLEAVLDIYADILKELSQFKYSFFD